MLILDANCFQRHMWKRPELAKTLQNHGNLVVYLDRDPRVKPMIQALNEYQPFRDHIFDEIYYDPPQWFPDPPVILITDQKDPTKAWAYQYAHTDRRIAVGEEGSSSLLIFPLAGPHRQPPDLPRFNAEARRTLKNTGKLHVKLIEGPPPWRPNQQEIEQGLSSFQPTEATYPAFQSYTPLLP
jgi:hypothetical protein